VQVLAARVADSNLTLQKFQAILGAEVSPAKARAILISGSPIDQSPLLTEAERNRVRKLDPTALEHALSLGVGLITEPDFPELLQESNPHPALFFWGDMSAIHQPTIGIVGTRNASAYGKACAQKFAEALAQRGVTIVSGGALGIDAAAHRGALAVDGRTVAVLANGVDIAYPAAHGGLFEEMRTRGGQISQYACGSKPNEYKFLQRNGLIAALSQAVLVIEAPARSGALRTANVANDLGRPVMVVPSSIEHQNFFGSFGLIRDGATLVHHPDQVLEFLDLEPTLPGIDAPVLASSSLASRILDVLTIDAQTADKIADLLGSPTSDILAELTLLELDNRVMRTGPGYAIRP